MKNFLAAILVSSLSIGAASAGPLTALSCVSQATKTFVTVGLSTDLFAPAAPERILAYSMTVGKLDANGEVASKKVYEDETNMKIFPDDAYAYDYVTKNTVVVPMVDTASKQTTGAVLVEAGKKKVTVIDTDYETVETLTCLRN